MKKVLDYSTVAHYWANKIQDEATTSSRNFYYNNKTIFSYGGHFPIAKHLDSGIVLFTLRTYSNTTAKHIRLVSSACSHLDKLYCYYLNNYSDNGTYEHEQNFERWAKEIKSQLAKMQNARKKEMYFNEITRLQNQAKTYAKYYKVKPKKEYNSLFNYTFEDAANYAEKSKQAALKEQKKVQTFGKKCYQKYVDLWHKNEKIELTSIEHEYRNKYMAANESTLLRVSGSEIETSKGVKLPIDVAKRYLKLWQQKLINSSTKILDYAVRECNDKGLIVGCHNIPATEINYIASRIN